MALRTRKNYIVTEPRVYVLGTQQVHQDQLGNFLTDEGYPDWGTTADRPGEVLCEFAGRVCYMSFGGGRDHAAYIRNLKEQRHGSVLEHATITFALAGVSRSFTHECVRHRSGWSYSQLSQRYVDASGAQMVEPPLFRTIGDYATRERIREQWEACVRCTHKIYEDLVGELEQVLCPPCGFSGQRDTALRKAIRGAARSVLPNATETKIVCTTNARAFRHFLEMRCSPAADAEIRQVAYLIYRSARPFWPDILGDYETRRDGDGEPYLVTDYVKV